MKFFVVLFLLLTGIPLHAADPPTILDPTAANPSALQGLVNQPYSLRLQAINGTPPYTWSASELPPGLKISAVDGVISGVPVLSGPWSGTKVYAEDSKGNPTPNARFLPFVFGPYLSLTPPPSTGSPAPVVALKKPFVLGRVQSSNPGAEITLTLADPWIVFATDTTCTKTTNQLILPKTAAPVSPIPLMACVLSLPVPNRGSSFALIRAAAPNYQAVATGMLVNFGADAFDRMVDLGTGAMDVPVYLNNNSISGPPSIAYFPFTAPWLGETDACVGQSNSCSVSLAPLAPAQEFAVGDQIAARLEFPTASGSIGSILATARFLPSNLSITSKGPFSGLYDWSFRESVSAQGGSPPYTWSAAGLPAALSISSDGVLSGAVLQAGNWQAFLTVTDSLGFTTSQASTFSFQQGTRPVLALAPAKPTPNPDGPDPIEIATLSSSPSSATVTLSMTDDYFGFASANSNTPPPTSCPAAPVQQTIAVTRAPVKIFVCNKKPFSVDSALRIYVTMTATSPGFPTLTVVLPLQELAGYFMQVASPVDISGSGSANTTVSIVANSSANFFDDHLNVPTVAADSSWLGISPVDPADPCFTRASCSFRVFAYPDRLINPVVGNTYSGIVTFSNTGHQLAAKVSVEYQYFGRPVAVASTAFSGKARQMFQAQATASGGTGSFTWTSSDLPAGLAISSTGIISGSLGAGVTQGHLTVTDDLKQSGTSLVTFTATDSRGKSPLGMDVDNDKTTDLAVWRPSNGAWYIIPSGNPSGVRIMPWGQAGDVPLTGDFDGDGRTDYAVWRPSTGAWYVIPSGNPAAVRIVQWGLAGDMPVTGDFDGDGSTDYAVWRPSNGTWYIIPSSNPSAIRIEHWGQAGDVPLTGDFDGDGTTDYAVWRPSDGTWYIIPSSNPAALRIVHWGQAGDVPVIGDFDSDGSIDYAVWRPSNGTWYIIPSSNPAAITIEQWGQPGDVPVTGDFDGDGSTDYAVWRPSNGTWYIIPSSNPAAVRVVQWGFRGDISLAKVATASLGKTQLGMDIDGDKNADLAVWRPSNGTWYVIPSSNPAAIQIEQWGQPGDIPVTGDFDGDGSRDYAVWRPSTGVWYIVPSSNPAAIRIVQWGQPGDVPITGNFDGDGITDYAVWRPSTGTWYIMPSSNPAAIRIVPWGQAGDVPVAGDFDADGITDYAVWRPSDGNWYILPSSNPDAVRVVHWGQAGDVPVAGDFDGDGTTDYAVWRPSNGAWYIIPSSTPDAIRIVPWGQAGDVPITGDFDSDGSTDYAVWRPSTGTWFIVPSSTPAAVRVIQWGLRGDVPLAGVVLP